MKILIYLMMTALISLNISQFTVMTSDSSSREQATNVDESQNYKLRDFSGDYEEVTTGIIRVETDHYEPPYEDLEQAYPKLMEFINDYDNELEDGYNGNYEIAETMVYGLGRSISPANIVSSVPLFIVDKYKNSDTFFLFNDDFLYDIEYELSFEVETFRVTKYERTSDDSESVEPDDGILYDDVVNLDIPNRQHFHTFIGVVELYSENPDLGYTYAHINRDDNPEQKYLIGWPYIPDYQLEIGDEIRVTGRVRTTTEILFEEGSMVVPIMDVEYLDDME
ncbi:hypothetical protein HYO62_01685 [Aerococcaceae bacterium DSM 111022]|nr:hypothetical protein [Aerococcaceae bacterium DSM 111022]